jgi:hypothetical protein
MKINQLVNENKQRLDEKPMGILSKAGNTIMSKLGSGRASGKLQTGDIANKMHKEYDTYLGQTGEEPSADSILAFLKFKKYPTQNVAAYLASPEAQDQAPAGPGEAPASAPTATAPAAKAAPAEPVEPTMDPETPVAGATEPAAEPAAPKAAPSFNNQLAGGKQTVSTGGSFDPATMKNTAGTPAPTGSVPSTTAPSPTAAPSANGYNSKTGAAIPASAPSKDQRAEIQASRSAARAGGPQYGGNFDTQTGEPVDIKAQIKARLGKPDTNFKGYKSAAQAKGIQNASKSFAGKQRIAEAAVSGKIVDKAILIAAQDAAKMGIGASIGAAPAQGAPAASGGEQGGFMAGLKKGMGGAAAGAAAPTVTYEEVKAMVDQLAVADKQHLLTDLQKEVATAPTESRKYSGTKLAESRQYYSIFKK